MPSHTRVVAKRQLCRRTARASSQAPVSLSLSMAFILRKSFICTIALQHSTQLYRRMYLQRLYAYSFFQSLACSCSLWQAVRAIPALALNFAPQPLPSTLASTESSAWQEETSLTSSVCVLQLHDWVCSTCKIKVWTLSQVSHLRHQKTIQGGPDKYSFQLDPYLRREMGSSEYLHFWKTNDSTWHSCFIYGHHLLNQPFKT